MAEYFACAIVVSAVLSFLTYMSYRSGSEGEIKFASLILLLYALTVPLFSLISEFSSSWQFPEWGEDFIEGEGEYAEVAENAFCDGVKKLIAEKYGAPDSGVEVKVSGFDFENMRARHISVYLSGKAALLDWRSIQNYITEQGLGECEVFLDIG